jgi:hypothetical protein
MITIETPTRSGNFEQAENQIKQKYFTTISDCIKAEFIRLAVWLLIIWG